MVKKTAMPDVYEMVDTESKKEQLACVPTLKTSKLLRSVFSDKNVNDKVCMRCEFSSQFDKWIPIRVEQAPM
jgi:hypothetical protein